MHLDLVDPADVVFDRVLDGNDFFGAVDDRFERGVKGRRLAAAGRSGYEDDAIGFRDRGRKDRAVVGLHAQLCEGEMLALLRQQPQDQ